MSEVLIVMGAGGLLVWVLEVRDYRRLRVPSGLFLWVQGIGALWMLLAGTDVLGGRGELLPSVLPFLGYFVGALFARMRLAEQVRERGG